MQKPTQFYILKFGISKWIRDQDETDGHFIVDQFLDPDRITSQNLLIYADIREINSYFCDIGENNVRQCGKIYST